MVDSEFSAKLAKPCFKANNISTSPCILCPPIIQPPTNNGRSKNQPTTNGSATLTNRTLKNTAEAFRFKLIRLKKPAIKKNSAMRKEWLTNTKALTLSLVLMSITAQPMNTGINDKLA